MAVILVILTFAVLLTIELVRERRRDAALLLEGEALHNAIESQEPRWVSGFKLPTGLGFHPGHMWVHWVAPDQAFVGIDDFARRLLGRGTSFSLPAAGTDIDQGESIVLAQQGAETVRLRAPVGGEIIGINPRLGSDPDLAYRDSYGRGWIFKLRSSHLARDFSNLLGDSLAMRWIEDTNTALRLHLMAATGSVIQDGGESVEDIGGALDLEAWRDLTAAFLSRDVPPAGGG